MIFTSMCSLITVGSVFLGFSGGVEFGGGGGRLATAFDLVAFRLSMIAPVKKSVNHLRTVASMRETGWEQY